MPLPPLGLPADASQVSSLEAIFRSALSYSCRTWRKMDRKKTLFVTRPHRRKHSVAYTLIKGAAIGFSPALMCSRLGRMTVSALPGGTGDGPAAIVTTHRNRSVERSGRLARLRGRARPKPRIPRSRRRAGRPCKRTVVQGIWVDTTCNLLSLISRRGRHGP